MLRAAISLSAAKTCCLPALLSLDVAAVSYASQSRLKSGNAMSADDRTIPTTCQVHGRREFCNLRVSKINGEIVLNPHVDGSCVLSLDRTAATQLFDILGEWLG